MQSQSQPLRVSVGSTRGRNELSGANGFTYLNHHFTAFNHWLIISTKINYNSLAIITEFLYNN
jgi:hypothetical protein